jgi:fucokinase
MQVLIVEQMLTTGGGWQDQVGGLLPGVKVGHSKAALPLKVGVQSIVLSDEFLTTFGSHLVLVYTGRTRLARNLLQNVIRNWYSRDPDIVQTEDDLVSTAWLCAEAFQKGTMNVFTILK